MSIENIQFEKMYLLNFEGHWTIAMRSACATLDSIAAHCPSVGRHCENVFVHQKLQYSCTELNASHRFKSTQKSIVYFTIVNCDTLQFDDERRSIEIESNTTRLNLFVVVAVWSDVFRNYLHAVCFFSYVNNSS